MPESNPPYPFNVWPIGGTEWIGYPNATSYPLTTALYGSKHWQWLKKANIQIYGWANVGFNVSTSNKPGYANLPAAYAEKPNTIQADQQVLYIERQPDTRSLVHTGCATCRHLRQSSRGLQLQHTQSLLLL